MLNVKNKVKELFEPRKDIHAENREAKTLADKNRAGAEKLLASMKAVDFITASKDIPEDRLSLFKGYIAVLTRRLQEAPTVGTFDTKEIDQELQKNVKNLQKALKRGDVDTIIRIIRGLQYGIRDARTDLQDEELASRDSIVQKRLEKVKAYISAADLAEKIYVSNDNIKKKDKEIQEATENYREQKEKVDHDVKARPDLQEKMATLRPGIDEVPYELKELDTQIAKLLKEKNRIGNLRTMRTSFNSQKIEYISQLRNLEDQLSVQDSRVSQETMEIIDVMNHMAAEQLAEREAEVLRLRDMDEQYASMIKSVYAGGKTGENIMTNWMDYEKMLEEEQEREAGIRRGLENQKHENSQKQLNVQ